MWAICTATVDNLEDQVELCEEIEALGCVPSIVGNVVNVEYEGEKPIADELIKLFERYECHGTLIQS